MPAKHRWMLRSVSEILQKPLFIWTRTNGIRTWDVVEGKAWYAGTPPVSNHESQWRRFPKEIIWKPILMSPNQQLTLHFGLHFCCLLLRYATRFTLPALRNFARKANESFPITINHAAWRRIEIFRQDFCLRSRICVLPGTYCIRRRALRLVDANSCAPSQLWCPLVIISL